jgi:glycerate 2-kinase
MLSLVERMSQLVLSLKPTNMVDGLIKYDGKNLIINEKKIPFDGHIYILGIGKPAVEHVSAVKNILGDKVTDALAITKKGHSDLNLDLNQIESDHPFVSTDSLNAASKAYSFINKITNKDLLIFCLSGGASALVCDPVREFSLEEYKLINQDLVEGGASIIDTNALRKSLCSIKNGGLFKAFEGQNVLNLIISDVPTKDWSFVGSSPNFYQPFDKEMAINAAIRFIKSDSLKEKVVKYIKSKEFDDRTNQKKSMCSQIAFQNFVLGDFYSLMDRAAHEFSHYKLSVISGPLDTSVEDAIQIHLDLLKNKENVLSGGEAPVLIKQQGGLGGRNMHFVALMAKALFLENQLSLTEDALKNIFISSIGTDGGDGPTDFAGAWLDFETFSVGPNIIEYIEQFNTLEYFKKTNTLYKTGPTGTNLMDLRLILLKK